MRGGLIRWPIPAGRASPRASLARPVALLVALTSLLALLLTLSGCRQQPGRTGSDSRSEQPSPSASGYGETFLGLRDCSSRGRTAFQEIACGSERAAARVIARHDGSRSEGPRCPDRTDFVLHIAARPRPAAQPQGYACMRNLEPPHPGDPGGGGGPLTIVGDCVYTSRLGEVKETACDGSGERAPEFTVTAAVRARPGCPASTQLYVQLGGNRPVGCARRV
ncbi:hypothetical protein [Streptomyces sp. H27-D2]|uniref:hypothetical protein n=1 Tax=Streptomyces sp. H27-D2 TaxID=3046304 RepID=UPI002DBD4728|nr:hypothetical protein [Streptomyces sp. H27-D2]MEC4018103.1 hypothetical protein [Streptomyces sp. H27-D2]